MKKTPWKDLKFRLRHFSIPFHLIHFNQVTKYFHLVWNCLFIYLTNSVWNSKRIVEFFVKNRNREFRIDWESSNGGIVNCNNRWHVGIDFVPKSVHLERLGCCWMLLEPSDRVKRKRSDVLSGSSLTVSRQLWITNDDRLQRQG